MEYKTPSCKNASGSGLIINAQKCKSAFWITEYALRPSATFSLGGWLGSVQIPKCAQNFLAVNRSANFGLFSTHPDAPLQRMSVFSLLSKSGNHSFFGLGQFFHFLFVHNRKNMTFGCRWGIASGKKIACFRRILLAEPEKKIFDRHGRARSRQLSCWTLEDSPHLRVVSPVDSIISR